MNKSPWLKWPSADSPIAGRAPTNLNEWLEDIGEAIVLQNGYSTIILFPQ